MMLKVSAFHTGFSITHYNVMDIHDPTHSIHFRQLPLAIRRPISTPKYGWDRLDPNTKPDLAWLLDGMNSLK
jgi:hypothetical protein